MNDAERAETDQASAVGDGHHVSVERRDAVGVVWLDRPERRNAYTPIMAQQLTAALIELDADETISVIVVTGRGEYFSVGADLDINWRDPEVHGVETLTDPEAAPWKLATPIIAAINGDAIGVAFTWALQYDIRVVASDARVALAFNRIGIIPDRNSLWLLPRMIGLSNASDLLLTGRTITGAEAYRMGMATHCVPADQVLATAEAIAQDMAMSCAPISLSVTKALMYEFLEQTDRVQAYNYERRVLNWVRTLGETVRGVAAFKEKRPPRWATTKSQTIPAELR